MKKTIQTLSIFILMASFITFISCKDEGKLPTISFKTGTGYTSADVTVAKGATIKIGISAAKAEKKDILKTLNVSQSLDGAANTTLQNLTLSGTEADAVEKDFDLVMRNTAGTEKYTFTVTNRDGLQGQVSLTATVQ